MSNPLNQSDLRDFAESKDIWSKWDAARRLMAAKQMQAAANEPDFSQGFSELGKICIDATGLEQLLAIALLVRISEFVKREFKTSAADILAKTLLSQPEGFWTIAVAKGLPVEAKPSEIRENIALALTHAAGDWVVQYVIEALAREDRSARCRKELCRQLAIREPNLSRCLDLLKNQPWFDIWQTESIDRAARMRDLAVALAETLREIRSTMTVDGKTGVALAELMQTVVQVSPRSTRPLNLADAAAACLQLLDEILATEFTLIMDPEAYAPLAVISRWWQQSSYPPPVTDTLGGLIRKLKSAISFRARLGQRSETLTLRLRQALGASNGAAADVLLNIAETETGLAAEIDDWLRGRERASSLTSVALGSLLSGTSVAEIAQAIASILLECIEASNTAASGKDPQLASDVRRIIARVQALAAELKLTILENVGQTVEFNASAHRTMDGGIPSNPIVRIVRPMVVRQRDDGSHDIIERAIVVEAQKSTQGAG